MVYLIITLPLLLIIIIVTIILIIKKKKSNIGKIYQTTDGFLTSNKRNKKNRKVIVVDQRDDKAVAITKIYSKDGKDTENNEAFIKELVLDPKDHPSLTKKSVVGTNLKIGRKKDNQITSIFPSELKETNDSVNMQELKIIKDAIINKNKHSKTRKKTLKKWKKHFKQ